MKKCDGVKTDKRHSDSVKVNFGGMCIYIIAATPVVTALKI